MTLPASETLTVEFKSDRKRLPDDDLIEAVVCLANAEGGELWLGHLGLVDASAQPVAGAQLADFDPLERERLRQAVQKYGGDRVLLELDDEAMDGALGFTARQPDGRRLPTLCGLLVIGRVEALRQLVPTHEFAFQVLAEQAVRFNEFRNVPLLQAIEWLETNFRPYNPEQELQVGLFRVPVPKVDMGAFREAVANALIHRDYHRFGAVHVRLENEALVVSNPGGLERQRNAELPIDSLIALSALREFKRVSADELAVRIQREAASAKRTLEALTEAGLVEAHGSTKGRSYTLSVAVYQHQGNKAAYTRQAGFAPIQHEQMVLNFVRQHGQIRRAEVMDLCRLSEGQAKELIRKLKERGQLVQHGERRAAYYTAGS